MNMAIIRINRFIVVCDIYSLTLCNSTKIVYFSKSQDRLRSPFFALLCVPYTKSAFPCTAISAE